MVYIQKCAQNRKDKDGLSQALGEPFLASRGSVEMHGAVLASGNNPILKETGFHDPVMGASVMQRGSLRQNGPYKSHLN